jgi:hypothetical protein
MAFVIWSELVAFEPLGFDSVNQLCRSSLSRDEIEPLSRGHSCAINAQDVVGNFITMVMVAEEPAIPSVSLYFRLNTGPVHEGVLW